MNSRDEKGEDRSDIVQDGEAVSVAFYTRDEGRGWSAALEASDRLWDIDTGAAVSLDHAHVAIQAEAAREGMSLATYLRDRLHYTIERNDN